jgi:rare lipoprotein A
MVYTLPMAKDIVMTSAVIRILIWLPLLLCLLSQTACSSKKAHLSDEYDEVGLASYYDDAYHGKKTANGTSHDKYKMTAAHPRLPFGSEVEVTNLSNSKAVSVLITDRGPFVRGRIIDLSRAAGEKIDMIKEGVVKVGIRYRIQ